MANKTRVVSSPGQVLNTASANAKDKRVKGGHLMYKNGSREEKTFGNFQCTKGEMLDFIDACARFGINKSAFIRKCMEILSQSSSEKEAMTNVIAYIASLKFKRADLRKKAGK